MAIHYLDFDLSIETIDPVTGHYRARVLASPVGEASTEFVLPFSAVEVENYILKMGRPRQGMRGLNSSEGRAAQEFGRKLYDAIFQGEVRDCLRSSLSTVNQQADQGLRLRLRLSDAPALADLPWEYLYDTSFRRFFAHSAATPLVRYLDLPERIQPLAVQPPLKILVMIASPRDYGQLDVEGEWRKVQAALADLVQRGLVTLTRLDKATLTALQRQLRREQYHIFHFIGHGGFDQKMQEGVLLLEDETGLTRLVAGGTIGALLHDHRSLRLAVLNACEGARTAQSDPFAGVAQTLVQQGIPAVIAMQFEITDRAAITFAHEFYSALADHYPVDAALAEARKAIFAEGNDVEWGTPVLYLRAQDGNIFALAELRDARPLPAPKVEPEPIKSIPRPSIFQVRAYLVGSVLIVLLLGGFWLGPRLFSLWKLGTPTLTPTTTATATITTTTPNLTATTSANAAAQTALAATQTALVPTTTLTPTATATLTPTKVVSPTAAATMTNMPTLVATPTPTPAPTSTKEIKPLPTPTLTITACQVGEPFKSIWSQFQTQLGCNIGEAEVNTITSEAFEGGFFIWLKSEDRMYILVNKGSWSVNPKLSIDWATRDPFSCDDAKKLGYPVLGFGFIWCTNEEVKKALGAPLDKELPNDFALSQSFEHGRILQAQNGLTFILFDNHNWHKL